MADNVQVNYNGKILECPVTVGTEGEKAFDIAKLRSQTGLITLDPGFSNTGSCKSAITYIDGEKGILRYRGIPIEQLAEHSTFVETAFLLIYGKLPNHGELEAFSAAFNEHSMIHEDMKNFFDAYPASTHPMASLSAMVCALSAYYPELIKENPNQKEMDRIAVQLLSKVRTICAFSYKKTIGEPFVYPRYDLHYVPNFLNMMFSSPTHPYKLVDEVVRALQVLLILHADHEQNCSTSTVRLVGSSRANLYASISAGICALWGPLHGGANQAVIEMLEGIQRDGGDVAKYITRAKDKNDHSRLMGFGHRVYKNFDPRAKIIKKCADDLLNKLGIHDPLLDLAKHMEDAALKDEYFISRKLYPNVDFYSGIIYRAVGIPLNMFPVMFAIGRMPGWIAHWKEMIQDPTNKIGRPFQIYVGAKMTDYVQLEQR
ncbi:MAG: citrate synthase [Candidatus Omnitrophica bacterium]|nr:citrate synthase [Candidatus Omnitrophota bacterium]